MTETRTTDTRSIAIIGGGPAGLMAAEVLSTAGLSVDLYDAMPSVGRKFLLAGVGGMNITHSEPAIPFLSRYREASPWVGQWLAEFDADALRSWIHSLGIDTFVGSSGRVFPTDMKAAPLLRAWLKRLRERGVHLHTRHRWLGWDDSGALRFSTPDGEINVRATATLLALGGGSWARLGSDGSWAPLLSARGVDVRSLRPSNCGFISQWSAFLSERFAGQPLKQIIASTQSPAGESISRRGEAILTRDGLEGSLIYALSAALREQLEHDDKAALTLDLAPDHTQEQLQQALGQPRKGQSLSNLLRKKAGLDGVKVALVHECLSKDVIADAGRLAAGIKALPITLSATRPLEEAISSAGGVCHSALDDRLMLKALPGTFCAGEMLDWEAPTGGHLLTACFASGHAAAVGIIDWLQRQD
ncbi:MAG: TIGR03862 family flavoprotein [Pseudomonadaceae bacterium]